MKTTITKALQKLEEANFSEFFEEIDKVIDQVPTSLQSIYNIHKQKFMVEGTQWDSEQQLRVFANTLDKYSKGELDEASLQEDVEKQSRNITTNTYIEKIEGTGHTFNF